jgi:DNA-binding transcriptional ArsR family regulator
LAAPLADSLKRVLWWLLAGSRGGANRAQLLLRLKERPYNAHQLAEATRLDYKTVRHHLKILEENQVVTSSAKAQASARDDALREPTRQYGEMYFLKAAMEQNWGVFEEIWTKVRPPEPAAGAPKEESP